MIRNNHEIKSTRLENINNNKKNLDQIMKNNSEKRTLALGAKKI